MDMIQVRKGTDAELEKLGVKTWGIWTCEASEFDYSYSDRETCFILEGKVTVKTPAEEANFGKGDLVIFPKGLSCRWIVHQAVKKHYKFG